MQQGNTRIYLDHASSTMPRAEAMAAMRDAEMLVGNPGAIHGEAVRAKEVLENARAAIAHELGAKAREIIFTSGLTESINLAILGLARKIELSNTYPRGGALRLGGTHWVVSSIEHAAVLACFAEVERLGGDVTYIDPDERGIFSPDRVTRAIRPETVCISIGWANNEIGVVQPLRDIARAIHAANDGRRTSIILHTDAGQAPLYLSPQVHSLGVDLMSLGSNKLYGPHGIGALYVGKNVSLAPIILGGSQERELRAGTENVALAAGFAAAFGAVAQEREEEGRRLRALRDHFAHDLIARVPGAVINGDLSHALPHMLNISIPSVSSEYLTLSLDQKGVAVSTKSACKEGEERRSAVVDALYPNDWRAAHTLRFSLGRETVDEDCEKTLEILVDILRKTKP